MQPIPGGFPAAKRTPNAGQVRVTQSGIAAITADPGALLGGLVGGGSTMPGVISFTAPASCGGSTPICCPGGNPVANCGPINIDLTQHPGDQPRLEIHPASGASRLDVVVRARIKTVMDIPVGIPIVGDCGVKVDTTPGPTQDVQINAPISFVQDAASGTTRISVGSVTISNLTSDDVKLTGNFACTIASFGLGQFLSLLTDQLTGAIGSAIQDATCKACDSGNVAECGQFATACTDHVCQEGDQCLQELGLSGRMPALSLFGGLSPGTTGALDLYEVAGGYATTDNNGIALGLLGGMQPGGTMRDMCGPTATEPMAVTVPLSQAFQGNTIPGTSTPFGVGIGLHKSQLAQFGWAGYQGGLLCLTIGGSTIAQLNTDTLSLLSRSLGDLVEGSAPMAVGLRPQSPPEITLGENTFMDDGMGNPVLDKPLLDIKFKALEIDFFADVDDQYIRVFTLVTDVHLPIGLQTMGMGQLVPVIGNIDDAFTNVSVKNSEAVTESPAQLASLFPTLLQLVIPQLSGGLGAISLPSIGGLNLSVVSVTSVDNNDFLAIFANLSTAMAAPVHAPTIALAGIEEPPASLRKRPSRWHDARPPVVTLALDANQSLAEREYSYRIDGGTWSAWSTNRRPQIASSVFWLAGTHRIEVMAREKGKPETLAELPAQIQVAVGEPPARTAAALPFHGQAGEGGCTCDSSGRGAYGALPFALVIGLVIARRRKRRVARRARRRGLGAVVWLASLLSLPGCSCSDAPCGDTDCMDGEVPNGGLGRFNSIAADDQRVMVATYDTGLGDLVVVDATDAADPKYIAVDGVPDGVTPTYDPKTYRGGIEDAGPDVGAWTSIVIGGGHAMVAYQDREEHALKFAREDKPGTWLSFTLDAPNADEEVGQHTALALDADGHPVIAYLAIGIDDGAGHRATELRMLRGTKQEPDGNDWSSSLIAKEVGTCAGLCGNGTACIAGANAGDPETCTAVTNDCTATCDSGDVCIAGSCTTPLVAPTVATLASGTGLWVTLNLMPDGRLVATYYDRTKRALIAALESGPGTGQFAETTLDSVTPGDRGMWVTSTVDGTGTVHVAYQDALGDQLMYTTFANAPGVPEVVDDGTRPGDRPHPVGAGASIYLVNGTPTIAYQDGMTSDVFVAAKSGGGWSKNPSTGQSSLLDGFAIAVTTAHGSPVAAWGQIDPAAAPNRKLVIQAP